jgi:hypothetical protein
MKLKDRLLAPLFNLGVLLASAGARWLSGVKVGLLLLRAKRYLFQPRPDDVFIASYPKSGTTLMQMMLYQITTDGAMDFPHVNSISPFYEWEVRHSNLEAFDVPSPRIFKTHLTYPMIPQGARVIYLLRDVRDVAVSAYHHFCLVTGTQADPAMFASQFLEGRSMFGSWFQHVESWWPRRGDENVLFLWYDEVTADLEGTARRVADFCGFELREAELPRILERCGIDFMKRHQAKFDPRLHQVSSGEREFIRSGKSGTGGDFLSGDQRELLEKKLVSLAEKLDSRGSDPRLNRLTRPVESRARWTVD